MQKISTEKKLLHVVSDELTETAPDSLVVLAGHFPLRVDSKSKNIYEELKEWGAFSLYTLELGLQIAKQAKELGKNVKLLFLCDDNSYRDSDKKLLDTKSGLTDAQLDNRWRSLRNAFYKEKSGKKAMLPKECQKLFVKFGFSGKDILRHNQGKVGREDCLYFSEAVLRDPVRTPRSKKITQNVAACSREYIALIESNQFKIKGKKPCLVSFIPQKCSHYICDAVDFFLDGFQGVHIFMETYGSPTKKELYTKGVFLKKN